jgi:hypothetical protein
LFFVGTAVGSAPEDSVKDSVKLPLLVSGRPATPHRPATPRRPVVINRSIASIGPWAGSQNALNIVSRLEQISASIDQRFNALDARIDAMEKKIANISAHVEQGGGQSRHEARVLYCYAVAQDNALRRLSGQHADFADSYARSKRMLRPY